MQAKIFTENSLVFSPFFPSVMLIYWFVGWLALVFVFLLETIVSSCTGHTPGMEILIVWILILLAPFRAFVTEISKDFHCEPLFPRNKSVWFYAAMCILFLFLYKFGIQIGNSLLILFTITTLAFRTDGRVAFLVALSCLAFCPLLLMVGYNVEAETFAVYAYYFLVIGVLDEVFLSLSTKRQLDANIV